MQYKSLPKALSAIFALLLFAQLSTAYAAQLPDFETLVKQNGPAVVNISTTETKTVDNGGVQQAPSIPGMPNNSPFNEFFKQFFDHQGHPEKEILRSLGSGFIISPDGYIVTNDHVVDHADSIVVRLSDQREFPAKLVGADKRTDIALLKIKAHDLPTVKIGDSSKLQVGQWVLAIGSPFGFDHTATQGIVSALQRSLPTDTYVPFIQTDVAINPGNSGGPLFNLQGQVVGINSQIYTDTGGYMGLSFSIPINLAMNVVKQLKATGHVVRGWLGVVIQPVTDQLAKAFGLDRPEGALITKVVPKSPAAKAGLKAGDVIIEYDGHPVSSSSNLPPLVAAEPIGRRVPVKVMRKGETLTLETTVEQLTNQDEAISAGAAERTIKRLHIVVHNMSQAQREDADVGNRGVVIKKVSPGPAADAGLQPGDILLTVDHHDIHDVAQLARIASRLPTDRPVAFLVQRGESTIFVAIQVPK